MPAHKQGKKGSRKSGRGKNKAARSKWNSYAGIIGHSQIMKAHRIERRAKRLARLRERRGGFSDRRAATRFAKFGPARIVDAVQ